jgi:hypothetical protein
MVACTTLGLPYQEGTDAPCDLVETWCLFADVVEANLIASANVVGRTFTAVPFAKISSETSTAVSADTEEAIAFDSLEADTDNMVNLAADPHRVFPQRPGVYMIVATIAVENPTVNAIPELDVRYFNGTSFVFESDFVQVGATANLGSYFVHSISTFEVTAAHLASVGRPYFVAAIVSNAVAPGIVVATAQMAVTWVAEEVP